MTVNYDCPVHPSSSERSTCGCSQNAPHLLCVCRWGDGAGAARHPVSLSFTVWLFIRAQRVHISVATKHKSQSLQCLRREVHVNQTSNKHLLLQSHLVWEGSYNYQWTRHRKWIIVSAIVTQLTLSKAVEQLSQKAFKWPSTPQRPTVLTALMWEWVGPRWCVSFTSSIEASLQKEQSFFPR